MRVAVCFLLAVFTCATTATAGDATHGQLRQVETPPPLPILIEGLASIGNTYQLKKHAEGMQKNAISAPTPAPTAQGHVSKPAVVVKAPSCHPPVKQQQQRAMRDAVLAHVVVIEDTLKAIHTLLEKRP